MDHSWKDTRLSFEERAKNLVSQMTLEEKVSQMTYYSSALPRFGILEYNWWNECLHGVARAGVATMFPQPIGMAASFDVDRVGEAASIISDEARVKHHAADEFDDHGIYKGLTMWTPNINIFRDPRWGRGHETYGEDPYLTARMGVAFIKGLQGDDERYFKVIATAKHFAVHSGPESERHVFDAAPSRKDLAETYLYAFKSAVQEAGVYSVMGAYNRVYGEASCASNLLLQKILRDEWGFDGYVVSDCGAIEDIQLNHKIVATPEEAAALAVKNGCDLCCGQMFPHLVAAVEKGLIDEETITRAAYRLILARMRLGMFDPIADQPYANLSYLCNDSPEHHQKSLEMAEESLVLLKNDGILPLDRNLKTIAVIGPNADSRDALRGNYYGVASETYTVLEGLRALRPDIRYLVSDGCPMSGEFNEADNGTRIAEAMKAASVADLVLVVTGLNGDQEGEEAYGCGDRVSMELPECQRELIRSLALLNRPMVLLNMTGSATLFPEENHFGAILQLWYPGQMGGLATAKALFGEISPSGKLPVTFYRSMEQVPEFTDYSMNGRTYRYLTDAPAYPFGYGLSYARFDYSDLNIVRDGDGLLVRVTVKNVGSCAAREVTQVYIRFVDAPESAPRLQLAAFASTTLAAGETASLELTIAADRLCLFDEEGISHRHCGRIELFVGGSQPDARSVELLGVTPLKTEIDL